MSVDDRYIIDTPENIEFSYDVAGIGSRFLAAIVDTLILTAILMALGVVTILSVNFIGSTIGDTGFSIIIAIWILVQFVILWGYYIFFELMWNGQSPGKRAVQLRVVREGGRPITFAASAVRNLVRLVDFLPMFYGLGIVVMFIDRRARRLGDLTGGTVVVKERRAVSLESLTTRAEPLPLPPGNTGTAAPVLTPNVHLLTDDEYNLVQEFLRRRSELGRASRTRLALQLTNQLRERLGDNIAVQDHERFLEQVVDDYRRVSQSRTGHVSPSG